MDYNKDLTMESDFIGMFNYPAGRRRNNHNNYVNPSVIADAVNDYLDKHPVSAETAYEQAVDGGYTGTEAEFEQALANIATDPSDIDFSDIEGV